MYYDIVNSGERIKQLRAARRMTRQQLAEQIGLSVDALRKIEAGVNGAKIDTLISIAELFHITLDYTKQIAKLQNDVRRITANKSGLYEDYREQLITAEELCQYQREYESRVNEIEAQITELLHRRSLYEKEFHIDEGWEETVNKYMAKRKLTKELVDAFVSEIVFYDGNIEVKLLYDDFLKELLKVAEEREVSSNG